MKDFGTKAGVSVKERREGQPLSQKVREQIQEYIQNMDLTESRKLPREDALAQMFQVSRITVRKALDDLAAEGRIFRRQGKGTFVNAEFVDLKVTFNPSMEFMQMIRQSGYYPSMKLLHFRVVQDRPEIRSLLRLSKEDTLVEADKVFFADGKLCMFCRDFYSLSLAGGENAFSSLSTYEKSMFPFIYLQSGQKITWDKIEIDTAVSTEIPDFSEYLKTLGIGLCSYLYLREINYNEEDQPMIYVEEYIDTSIIRYNMVRRKDISYEKLGTDNCIVPGNTEEPL